MTITQINENDIITLALDGWLDHESSPELEKVVDSIPSAKQLVIDFSKVEYISSAGIRALVSAHRKVKELDAELGITHVNPEVMNILSMTGLDKKLNIQAD